MPAPVLHSSRKLQVKLCSHDDGQSLATHDNTLDDSSCFKHLAEIMPSEEPSPCRSFTRKQRKKKKNQGSQSNIILNSASILKLLENISCSNVLDPPEIYTEFISKENDFY